MEKSLGMWKESFVLAKLHGRESGSFDMGVRRVAWTRVWSCGNFPLCKVEEIGFNFRG